MKTNIACLFVCLAMATGLHGQTPVYDPVPEKIGYGDLSVRLIEWVTIPKSNASKPFARINMLRELPDGSGRMAVNDLNGYLYLIDEFGAVTQYLDLHEEAPYFMEDPGKGTGFGAFAFHPEFATNGTFFTAHSEEYGHIESDFKAVEDDGIAVQWVVTRWVADEPSSNIFSGTREEMFRMDFPTVIHGIQDITFNPLAEQGEADYGKLYVCIGEGGSSNARLHQNMQNTSSHLGTIWRIDPQGTNGKTGKYGVPSDNPLVNEESGLGEIWAYGFRNPHRLHFEMRSSGPILLACDIGELNLEEVNIITKGGNYGWNNREGTFFYDVDISRETVYQLPSNDDPDLIYPVAQYDHDEGLAIVTGHVWHSQRIPEFDGIFFMGDIPSGRIFYAPVDSLMPGRQYPLKEVKIYTADDKQKTFLEIVGSDRVDIRFGYDSNGEVYFLTKAEGKIYKLAVPDIPEEPLLGVEEYRSALVYPTHTRDRISVKLGGGRSAVTIRDLNGKLLLNDTVTGDRATFQVSGYMPGLYLVMVESKEGITIGRFVKQ